MITSSTCSTIYFPVDLFYHLSIDLLYFFLLNTCSVHLICQLLVLVIHLWITCFICRLLECSICLLITSCDYLFVDQWFFLLIYDFFHLLWITCSIIKMSVVDIFHLQDFLIISFISLLNTCFFFFSPLLFDTDFLFHVSVLHMFDLFYLYQVQLPDKIVIYELNTDDTSDMHYKVKVSIHNLLTSIRKSMTNIQTLNNQFCFF